MKAVKLYAQLEKDFITPALSDEWAAIISSPWTPALYPGH